MKKIIVSLYIALSCILASAQTDAGELSASKLADSIILEAENYLGYPYKYGASGPKSFDCAGFAQFIYKKFGYNLSRSSRSQVNDGSAVEGDFSQLQKGDLLIFSGSRGGSTPGHVGIFIGMKEDGSDFTFIHSDHSGVRISTYSEPYYKKRYLCARRILPDFEDEVPELLPEYPFDVEADVVVRPDTLNLADNDKRIVLFGGGRWAEIDAEGKINLPDSTAEVSLLLYPDGSWKTVSAPAKKKSAPAKSEKNEKSPAVQTETSNSEYVYHSISSGDTLSKIAKKYNTSVRTLCNLNGINETTVLHIGRKLRVK